MALSAMETVSSLKRVTLFSRAVEVRPRPWSLEGLGKAQMDEHLYGDAASNFQALVRLDPERARSWELLSWAYLRAGLYGPAIRSLESAVSICSKTGMDKNNDESMASMLQSLGMATLRAGFLDDAADHLARALSFGTKDAPRALLAHAEAHLQLARRSIIEGAYGHAMEHALACMKSARTVAEKAPSLRVAGKILGDAYSLADAIPATFFCPIEARQRQIDAIWAEGIHERESWLRSAVDIFEKQHGEGVSGLLDSGAAKYRLARAQLMHGKAASTVSNLLKDARSEIRKALQLDATLSVAWNNLALVEIALGRLLVAQRCLVHAIEMCSGGNPTAWTNLGFLYIRGGQTELAVNAFTTAQSIAPAKSIGWCGLGIALESCGRSAEAGSAFECAMQYNPHLQAKVGRGLAALANEEPFRAGNALELAVDSDPCNPIIWHALGAAYEARLDYAGALRFYNVATRAMERVDAQGLHRRGGIAMEILKKDDVARCKEMAATAAAAALSPPSGMPAGEQKQNSNEVWPPNAGLLISAWGVRRNDRSTFLQLAENHFGMRQEK